MTEKTAAAGGGAEAAATRQRGHAHISSSRQLLGVWAALVVMTYVTVAVTRFDLGSMGLWVAMAIATFKASLVALYFMHLRYDRPINGIIFLGTLLFVLLFVGLALMDTTSYQPELIPGYAPAITP
jgi:cytochrome c oxidase subunit IV